MGILQTQKAKWVLEYTKADGVMVGRGAIGKPWIFKLMKDYIVDGLEEQKLYSNLIYEVVIEHFNQMINYYGEYGVILFRKHLHTFQGDRWSF